MTVDPARRRVIADGEPIDLTATEFELLEFLCRRPGRVFPREHLLSEVWGYEAAAGTRTVDVHVAQLRAKLGDCEPDPNRAWGRIQRRCLSAAPAWQPASRWSRRWPRPSPFSSPAFGIGARDQQGRGDHGPKVLEQYANLSVAAADLSRTGRVAVRAKIIALLRTQQVQLVVVQPDGRVTGPEGAVDANGIVTPPRWPS